MLLQFSKYSSKSAASPFVSYENVFFLIKMPAKLYQGRWAVFGVTLQNPTVPQYATLELTNLGFVLALAIARGATYTKKELKRHIRIRIGAKYCHFKNLVKVRSMLDFLIYIMENHIKTNTTSVSNMKSNSTLVVLQGQIIPHLHRLFVMEILVMNELCINKAI